LVAGVAAIEIKSGNILAILEFITGVEEIFDVSLSQQDLGATQSGHCTRRRKRFPVLCREHLWRPGALSGINAPHSRVLYRNPDRRPAAAFLW
jgi:hypothetical protein